MVTIEMLDTAIKVATGFLLGSVLLYLYLRRSGAVAQRNRDDLDRRRLLLQQVSDQVGKVHHVYQQYLSLVVEYSRMGVNWPEYRRKELRKKTEELVAVFQELNAAQATLLLLGEKKLERALRVYGARIVAMRRLVSAEKLEFSGDELNELDDNKKEIQGLREAFYDSLSDRFMTSRQAA
ncbi:hypothetical protein [Gynuella sunshinyii]|nr:hypothetical protein [Gynuella sunshinyii]